MARLQRGGLDSSPPVIRGAEALWEEGCCRLSREVSGLPGVGLGSGQAQPVAHGAPLALG